MGMLDDAKRLGQKAKDLVARNDEKVKQAIDKAAAVADRRTAGKYRDKIAGASAKAKDAVDKLPEPADDPGDKPTEPEADAGHP